MRRIAVGAVAALVFALAVSHAAAGSPTLNHGARLNRAQCPAGKLVVNVNEAVLNDVDSGIAGNNWAYDDVVRHIQVVQVAPNTFCATVKYDGLFTTVEGTSPGATGTLTAGVRGTFQGGYVTTIFTGTLRPGAPVRGSLGTIDYQCDVNANCPGYVDWSDELFDHVSGFDLAWWGWIYRAGDNGTWVNAITGNSGDITGS